MKREPNRKGFTLAETLAVVGILGVLAAVIFVGVMSYLRGLTKLQYDGYAKEIFIAAQNHLAAAESENYLGRKDGFGTQETPIGSLEDTGKGAYYFLVSGGNYTPVTSPDSVLSLMLPPGSLDDTVRLGGCYIVRYHKDSAQVLDVFYWESKGRFAHSYADSDYAAFLQSRADADALRDYKGAVIGYYGGTEARSAAHGELLKAPGLVVRNGDQLVAEVTDPNVGVEGNQLMLVITGKTSGKSQTVKLTSFTSGAVTFDSAKKLYTVVLDDVTRMGLHFSQQFCTGGNALIPGEDVTLQAISSNTQKLSNVASGAKVVTNSLYGDGSTAGTATADNQAEIASFRHLENLDPRVSGVNGTFASVQYKKAFQSSDLDWNTFMGGDLVQVRPLSDSPTALGCYLPVNANGLAYDGRLCTVANVKADLDGDAGLFGKLENSEVKDLRLEDFSVNGQNAGALAGSAASTAVTNVLAVNSGTGMEATVKGSQNGGGLIGSLTGGSVTHCAAALVVSGNNAGGLVGKAEGSAAITGSYAGGHTDKGKYLTENYNVTGTGKAGGLVGDGGDATIRQCYSTCSVSGSVAGGLVGSAGGSVSDCYATGLVNGATRGAFAGAFSGTASGCHYYQIINETLPTNGPAQYLGAVPGGDLSGVSAMDASAKSLQDFLGSDRKDAAPYDPVLAGYYQGKYALKTVSQLGAAVAAGDWVNVHYGDWPAPETAVVNRG